MCPKHANRRASNRDSGAFKEQNVLVAQDKSRRRILVIVNRAAEAGVRVTSNGSRKNTDVAHVAEAEGPTVASGVIPFSAIISLTFKQFSSPQLINPASKRIHGSSDHRGTVETPGRVVTLVPYERWASTHKHEDPHGPSVFEDCICWGVAYKIADDKVDEVLGHLDHREKNGYDALEVPIYNPACEGPVVTARVYVATGDNEDFVGPVEFETMARQIAVTRGPSGWNADCLHVASM
ncbi:hypothetical protein HKX48_005645 [Thoreauomyces humboldtii]|nr:hypothetical protein HKX48_005645 [Thoreauomyces humboldtii]